MLLPAPGNDGELLPVGAGHSGSGERHGDGADVVIPAERVFVHDPDGNLILVDNVEAEGLVPDGVLAAIDRGTAPECLGTTLHDAEGVLLAEPVHVLESLSILEHKPELSGIKGHQSVEVTVV